MQFAHSSVIAHAEASRLLTDACTSGKTFNGCFGLTDADLRKVNVSTLSHGYMCDFLLAKVIKCFEKVSPHQRTIKTARVATHEHAMQHMKKSQRKVARVE